MEHTNAQFIEMEHFTNWYLFDLDGEKSFFINYIFEKA